MSLGSVPCACGGENANCFRCWGTGMVEALSVPPDGEYLGTHLAKQEALRALSPCPECGVTVMGLSAHLQFAHGPQPKNEKKKARTNKGTKSYQVVLVATRPKPERKKLQSPADVDPTLHFCVVCGVAIRSLTKHFNRTGHSPAGGSPKEAVRRASGPVRGTPNLLKCPRCRAQFPNATQLASHVVGSHGLKAFREWCAQTTSQSRPRIVPPKAGRDSTALVNANQEQQLDAKRYWGHSFRDHGQFGSYPSHDDMSDESSA